MPFLRPKKLSNSKSNILHAFKHAINFYKKKGEVHRDFVSLGACCPIRSKYDIDRSISIYKRNKALTLISVKEIEKPIDWVLEKNKNNKLKRFIKKSKFVNRQNYKEHYIPNGSIYVFNTKKLLNNIKNNKDYFNERTFCYVMPKERSIDIDDINDLKLARFYLKNESFILRFVREKFDIINILKKKYNWEPNFLVSNPLRKTDFLKNMKIKFC